MEIIYLLHSEMTVTFLLEGTVMLELSHPVIIKPSRGTVLKWQISLCFIYPAVSTPLHGECVSIGTWWYFELHVLCDALDDPACFFAYLFCSASSPLLSHSVQIKEEQKGEKEFGNEINRAI